MFFFFSKALFLFSLGTLFASEPFPTCDPVSEFLTDPTALGPVMIPALITDRASSTASAPVAESNVELAGFSMAHGSSISSWSDDPEFLYPAPSVGFCAEWNPEFPYNGHRCCTVKSSYKRAKRGIAKGLAPGRCAAQRRKASYCDERTEVQIDYADRVTSGQIEDPLAFLAERLDRRGPQAYCTVNNGFLAFGRPLIATGRNRLVIRNEQRCLNFGTDRMVGMLEWVGRRIARQYPSVQLAEYPPAASPVIHQEARLIVGDISAPKGGCLAGRPGRKGHASHTSGQDVDFAFFNPKRPGVSSVVYDRQFDAEANWWLIKQIFRNPFACVKVAFLDRTLIRKLSKAALGDPDWVRFSPYIRHSRGHANHWHVRVGSVAGDPGCISGLNPGELDGLELDELEENEDFDGDAPVPLDSIDRSVPGVATASGQGVKLKE